MSLSAKVDKSHDDLVCLDLLNKEAKQLDTNHLIININFKEKFQQYLEDISAHDDDRMNGGFVNKELIKAEFQADYIIAYRVISGATDVIFSTDSDFAALCPNQSFCIKSMRLDNGNKHKKKRKNWNIRLLSCLYMKLEVVATSTWMIWSN